MITYWVKQKKNYSDLKIISTDRLFVVFDCSGQPFGISPLVGQGCGHPNSWSLYVGPK
jgi:hypothetical protein